MIADGIAVQVGRPGRPVRFHTGAHPPAAVRRLLDRLARIFAELARA